MGAGRDVSRLEGEELGNAIEEFVASTSYKTGAQTFAERYAGFDAGAIPEKMAENVERILGTQQPSTTTTH